MPTHDTSPGNNDSTQGTNGPHPAAMPMWKYRAIARASVRFGLWSASESVKVGGGVGMSSDEEGRSSMPKIVPCPVPPIQSSRTDP